jgi:UDP-2,3-diacylglucosamine hydrolase
LNFVLKEKNKIYFVSDSHFGIDYDKYSSEFREELMLSWLDEIKSDALELHLCGDMFDFWFEYKYLVPRGFTRLFAKLRELSDLGVKLYYYLGNHDMWTFGYIEETIGAKIFKGVNLKEIDGKIFYIGHGDGLGPYDIKYNFLKKIFSSKFMQFMFRLVHPSISFRIATSWSSSSRKKHKYPKQVDFEKEWLVRYARTVLENQKIDYFIFGHRHIPFQYNLNANTLFTNLGDWLFNFTYAVYDGENLLLKTYEKAE